MDASDQFVFDGSDILVANKLIAVEQSNAIGECTVEIEQLSSGDVIPCHKILEVEEQEQAPREEILDQTMDRGLDQTVPVPIEDNSLVHSTTTMGDL